MVQINRVLINRRQKGNLSLRLGTMQKDQLLGTVGQRIRELRRAKGFSQEGFAAAAGLDRSYYGGIERGERNFSVRHVVRIAAKLGVEVGDMFPPIAELAPFSLPADTP